MCGIFGVVAPPQGGLDRAGLELTVSRLFKLSESRGKEAAGIAVLNEGAIQVYKEPASASTMIRSRAYRDFFDGALGAKGGAKSEGLSTVVIGHSRLVTNGFEGMVENNQPVVKDGVVGIHNGIIVNDAELWDQFPTLSRSYQVDTEVVLSLIRHFFSETKSLVKAVQKAFAQIRGAASIATVFQDLQQLLLATNTGSLYVASDESGGAMVFASERVILDRLLSERKVRAVFGAAVVRHVTAGSGLIIDLFDQTVTDFRLSEDGQGAEAVHKRPGAFKIVDLASKRKASIRSLRRCTRCILPETMPMIRFDAAGVCNFCQRYKKIVCRGPEALEAFVSKYRRTDGRPDCIVAFSGGRDSSYGLHYLKTELKMNPIAFTYDWGMVTDLARRNQARICGELGIEHILISADIRKKRANIRRNVEAWMKKPDLGMIPLFMAGDKQFFYYANKLKKQLGTDLVVFSANSLEKTYFKSGFCGVEERGGDEYADLRAYSISFAKKLKLVSYYCRQFLTNPSYFNRSLFDSLLAFRSSYMMPHDYLFFFDYIRWDEKQIMDTLREKYDWEVATDTGSTWRIGDGTAAFYNYIYYTVAGFTENDTFRSNQIREGLISREEALQFVQKENEPRWPSIREYADIVGFDYQNAIRTIESIPKLGPLADA